MAIIYYYLLHSDSEKIKDGISISKFYDKIIFIKGEKCPCIFGYLTPKDCEYKRVNHYTCLELDVDIDYCYVLNGDLEILRDSNIFYDSLIPLSSYIYGTYRNPIIAITQNVEVPKIKIFNKDIGFPIIFDNSNNLYKKHVVEELRQKYNDFDETMLAVFFMLMSHKGKFKLLDKQEMANKNTLYIYEDNETKKIYTVSILEG